MLLPSATRSRRTIATRLRSELATVRRPPVFKLNEPLQSGWKAGDGAARAPKHVRHARKTIEVMDALPRDLYQIMGSAIVPRPIALVSSLSADGVPNLAPFSYFSMVGHNPPMISISCSLSDRRPKDTRENILATREFSVNIVSEHLAAPANATSVECPAHVDEWRIAGLTKRPSIGIKPALVDESLVNFECELYNHLDISPPIIPDAFGTGEGQQTEEPEGTEALLEETGEEAGEETGPIVAPPTTTLILGLIQRIHVNEGILTPDGTAIDPAKLQAVARMGGRAYANVNNGFELERPAWSDLKVQMEAKRVLKTPRPKRGGRR